ncbi:putative LRR containing protein [Trachipleistophora hominis]|uniref:Putative LRR containing protein n=1 Tax=Trachipleistophora hominis TaxID=72359 RepID=L7JXF2_TRAHO|nr:putative LRR containing protein [Trachipleistophora hominis]
MLPNLCSYVETTVRYILWFKATGSELERSYAVFDDINDTTIQKYLEQYDADEVPPTVLAQQRIFELRHKLYDSHNNGTDVYNPISMFYYNRSSGIRHVKNKQLSSLIRVTNCVTMKIIYLPFTKPFFLKIMLVVTKNGIPDFTEEEILLILRFFAYTSRKDLFAYAICRYLYRYINFFNCVLKYNRDARSHADTSVVTFKSFVFPPSDSEENFTEVVRSNLALKLISEGVHSASITGGKDSANLTTLNISFREISLCSLFCRLSMNFNFLETNIDHFNTSYRENLLDSITSLEIFDIDEVPSANLGGFFESGRDVLNYKLSIINSMCLLERVNKVTLKFYKCTSPLATITFINIKYLDCIVCECCSDNFITSIPHRIKVMIIDREPQTGARQIITIPGNAIGVSWQNCIFTENLETPKCIRFIEISRCQFGENQIKITSKRCKGIKITNTSANLVLQNIAGFCNLTLGTFRSSCFDFNVNETTRWSIKLVGARIENTVHINDNVTKVLFNKVEVIPGEKVVLHKRIQHLEISQSTGLFDLKSFIKLEKEFGIYTIIKVEKIQSSLNNNLALTLVRMGFDRTICLPNTYECIDMCDITVCDGAFISINKDCKTLKIRKCSGKIDISKVEHLDSLFIGFSSDCKIIFNMSDFLDVNKVHFHDICEDNALIIELLCKSKNIKRLKFTNHYSGEITALVEEYYDKNEVLPIDTLDQNQPDDHRSEELPISIPEKDPSDDCRNEALPIGTPDQDQPGDHLLQNQLPPISSLCDKRNEMINIILAAVFKKTSLDTLIELEITTMILNTENYCLLKKLVNLRSLKICPKKLNNEFLISLPAKLKVLDLVSSVVYPKTWELRYEELYSILYELKYQLKVLAVDVNLFFDLVFINDLLRRSLEILKIYLKPQYDMMRDFGETSKLELRELQIVCDDKSHASILKGELDQELSLFIDVVSNFINFSSLECLVFEVEGRLITIDPLNRGLS